MKKEYATISGYEIDIRATSSSGAESVISLLFKSNSTSALSVSQILEVLNKGKRRKLNRTNIDRVIRNLKRTEPHKIQSKKVSNTTYYWLSKRDSPHQVKNITTQQIKLTVETTTGTKKSKVETSRSKRSVTQNAQISENLTEKDLYPGVHMWLNNYLLDGKKFQYKESGGGFIDHKSKFSNPDLVGINQSQNIYGFQVVSVEVKNNLDKNAELIGFAQCCSYLLFSHYVLFVCMKPKIPEQEDRLLRLTQLCFHFGIGLRFIGETQLRVTPRLNEPKDFALINKIIALFQN